MLPSLQHFLWAPWPHPALCSHQLCNPHPRHGHPTLEHTQAWSHSPRPAALWYHWKEPHFNIGPDLQQPQPSTSSHPRISALSEQRQSVNDKFRITKTRTEEACIMFPCDQVKCHYLIHTRVLGGQIIFQESTSRNKPHPVASLTRTETLCKILIKWQLNAKAQAPKRKVEIQEYAANCALETKKMPESECFTYLGCFLSSSYHSMHLFYKQLWAKKCIFL